jgi:hypothetical protein
MPRNITCRKHMLPKRIAWVLSILQSSVACVRNHWRGAHPWLGATYRTKSRDKPFNGSGASNCVGCRRWGPEQDGGYCVCDVALGAYGSTKKCEKSHLARARPNFVPWNLMLRNITTWRKRYS